VAARVSEFEVERLSQEARMAGEVFACEDQQGAQGRTYGSAWFVTAAAAAAALALFGFGLL
jgi:hypothetical protein